MNLQKRRIEKGLSQSELARLAGISLRTLQSYEGGNPYQSSFTADTGTYRVCADKVVCKRVYEVERVLLN